MNGAKTLELSFGIGSFRPVLNDRTKEKTRERKT